MLVPTKAVFRYSNQHQEIKRPPNTRRQDFQLLQNGLDRIQWVTAEKHPQVKSQVGCRRDPAIPTWDPGWEWRDPTLDSNVIPPGIPPKMQDLHVPPGILGGIHTSHPGS